MKWSSIGEWIFIIIFCSAYALIANIESRMYPIEESLAFKTRAMVNAKIKQLDVELALKHCEAQALRIKGENTAVIWFYNKERFEYWCGFIKLDRAGHERLMELKPYTTVLNSDSYIRRLKGEGNKYKRKRTNIQKITSWGANP